MKERRLNSLLLDLGAQLEASERRADDEAADDLALSLSQDRVLADALCRSGTVDALTQGGGRARVGSVGHDFLLLDVPSTRLLPLSRVAVAQGERGEPPVRWDLTLAQLCRLMARAGAEIEVRYGSELVAGRLESAARDFIAIARARERVLVAYPAVTEISLLDEGLTGVL